MNRGARAMGLLPGLLAIGFVGLIAYIRLAPADPAAWHVDLAAAGFRPPAHAAVFCIGPGNRYGPVADATALLAQLDAIATATPRTKRMAGSAEAGRITWVTRSAIMGYPDYTTAQVMPGPGLCILGRQRFGREDLGVNAARIGGWAQDLLELPAPPAMTGI